MAHVDLILATRFINSERAADGDVQAVVRAEFQKARLVAKADAADLRARVLEGEVEVAGLRGAVIGDFPFDPNIRERSFKDGGDLVGDLADFPDPLLRLE